MRLRSIPIAAALLALAAPGAAAAPQGDVGHAPGPVDAQTRLETPRAASVGEPPMTRESDFEGAPLGWPMTFGLTGLAVVLLGYVPWRARRAMLARRAVA